MNVDSLTIKEAREIARMFGAPSMASTEPCEPKDEIPVLVTTEHRGVFFGFARNVSGETITLRAGRNCLYWPAENKGFIGLATTGPVKGARVGPAATITLRNITSVVECSEEAVKAWESFPWSK